MPILTMSSPKSVLHSNLFRPARMLKIQTFSFTTQLEDVNIEGESYK